MLNDSKDGCFLFYNVSQEKQQVYADILSLCYSWVYTVVTVFYIVLLLVLMRSVFAQCTYNQLNCHTVFSFSLVVNWCMRSWFGGISSPGLFVSVSILEKKTMCCSVS